MSGRHGGSRKEPEGVRQAAVEIFRVFKPKVKRDGIVWINIGDAYNTPVKLAPDDP